MHCLSEVQSGAEDSDECENESKGESGEWAAGVQKGRGAKSEGKELLQKESHFESEEPFTDDELSSSEEVEAVVDGAEDGAEDAEEEVAEEVLEGVAVLEAGREAASCIVYLDSMGGKKPRLLHLLRAYLDMEWSSKEKDRKEFARLDNPEHKVPPTGGASPHLPPPPHPNSPPLCVFPCQTVAGLSSCGEPPPKRSRGGAAAAGDDSADVAAAGLCGTESTRPHRFWVTCWHGVVASRVAAASG